MNDRFEQVLRLLAGETLVNCSFCQQEIKAGEAFIVEEGTSNTYCHRGEIGCIVLATFKEGRAIRGASYLMPEIRDLI